LVDIGPDAKAGVADVQRVFFFPVHVQAGITNDLNRLDWFMNNI